MWRKLHENVICLVELHEFHSTLDSQVVVAVFMCVCVCVCLGPAAFGYGKLLMMIHGVEFCALGGVWEV